MEAKASEDGGLPVSRHLGFDGSTSTNMIELRQKRAVMSIFVVHSDDGASSKAVEKALEAVIFEECKKRSDSIQLLLLYVTGGAGSSNSSSTRRSRRSCLNCKRLYEFVNAVGQFPWPVIGFADGCVSSLGSSLLEAADHVLASPTAKFKLAHTDTVMSVKEAAGLGRVQQILESSEALMATHREYCKKGPAPPAEQGGPVAELLSLARARGRPRKGLLACTCAAASASAAVSQAARPPMPAAGIAEEPQAEAEARSTGLELIRARGSQEAAAATVPKTTVVIYDVPTGITSGELAATIGSLGFGDRYNLLYIEDVRSGGQARGSFGLVNFLTRNDAEAFADAFYNYSASGGSSRTASGKLQLSNVQGLKNIIECWIRSSSTGPVQLFF